MEIVQRWSEFGDFSWGFLVQGAFYPLHVSKAYVEAAWKEIEKLYYPSYFEDEGWYLDDTHFTLNVHPADLPPGHEKKFTVVEKPKPVKKGRFFREDE